ncbi:unnamed protein product [Cylindrotheca closterium]|uniref:RRM domain-containing protein n=1 Tax=Cylindrotheca closterium TaxID=2856 RepID=A0AAD2JI99_9STRA|nr:unnamed protein product [Cylindrotheca closterium]
MSLLGSIFGDDSKSKKDKGELSNLFQNKAELPDRPNHEPVSTINAKRKLNDGVEPESKRKRKPRKKDKDQIEGTDGDGETTEKDGTKAADGKEEMEDEETEKNKDRTIFVGNLPLATTTRKSLSALFKDCGPIASTRIRSIPVKGIKLPQERAGDQNLMRKVCANTNQVDETLKDTVTGYVVFKTIESVEKALEINNKKIGGRRIRVDRASPTIDPSRSVFIGNLPYGAEESSLQDHFVKGCALDMGDVVAARIIRDKDTHQCKGFGYVLFREKNMIPAALKLHDTVYMKKQLRVLVCGKRLKGRKGEPTIANKKKAEEKEKVTVGAFRRLLSKQQKEASEINKRKRGQKKAGVVNKGTGVSKRAALEKKVDKRVKKLQKRASKGMGKAKR